MARYVSITGSEWVEQLLRGERDFRGKRIIPDEKALERMKDVNDYLRVARLEEEPILLDGANLTGIVAPEIYAPHTKARGVIAMQADLSRAFLEHSDFGPDEYGKPSDLRGITFDNLQGAHLIMKGARVGGMSVFMAQFPYANITDLKGFDRARHIGTANWYRATMGPAEEEIINREHGYKVKDTN